MHLVGYAKTSKIQIIPASLYFRDVKRQQGPHILNSSMGVGMHTDAPHHLIPNDFCIVSCIIAVLLIRL